MEKKLNLHDLFGILFPGAVLCACAYFFLLKRWFPIEKFDWSATLILLPVAYVMGIMIHQFAHKLFHESGVAVKLMMDSDPKEPLTTTFTPDFKREVKKAYADLFKLSTDPKDLAQMYLLCNDFVLQQGKGIYVESHYAIYSLCRSMVLVSFLSGSAGFLGRLLSTGRSIHLLCLGLDYSILFLIGLSTTLATCTFWFAKERFIKTLAVAVYRAFYAAYCDLKMPSYKTPIAEPLDD